MEHHLTTSRPKVSVLMITYNHERFIAQAIASAVMQQTTFPIEIVIGEDCSTDGTRAIVQQFQQQYPHLIRLLLHSHNVGMMANFTQTYAACIGEYIAMLEGDDFWTDPYKLQKQVDFLEAHPDYAICAHPVIMIFEDQSRAPQRWPAAPPATVTLETLLAGNIIPTCSVVFRRRLPRIPAWFAELEMADWPLHILNAHDGLIRLLPEAMACYHVHQGGVWSSRSGIRIGMAKIKLMLTLQHQLAPHYHPHIHTCLYHCYYVLALIYLNEGKLTDAEQAFRHCLRYLPPQWWHATPNPYELIELRMALGVQHYLPALYPLLRILRNGVKRIVRNCRA